MTVDRDRCLVVGYRCRDLGLVEAEVAEKEEEESDREREREGEREGEGEKKREGETYLYLRPPLLALPEQLMRASHLPHLRQVGKTKNKKKEQGQ